MPQAEYQPPAEAYEPPKRRKPPELGHGGAYEEPKPPETTLASPFEEALVDQTMLAAARTGDIFHETPVVASTVVQVPNTIAWTAIAQNDPVATAVVADVVRYWGELHGGADTAAFLTASSIVDPKVREQTIAGLSIVAGYEHPMRY